MSHHYSGPNIGFPRGDARLDLTDLYAFPKPGDPGRSIRRARRCPRGSGDNMITAIRRRKGVPGRELGIFNGNSGLKDLESNSRLDLLGARYVAVGD